MGTPVQAGQQQPCFVLNNSTMCPEMSGYYMLWSAESNVTDTASFDNYISALAGLESASTMQTLYGCPNYNGKGIRYINSVLCNYFTDNSQILCSSLLTSTVTLPPRLPLCPSSCSKWIDSITTIFNNPSICSQNPSPAAAANRMALLTPGPDIATQNIFYGYCITNLSSVPEMACSAGVGAEAKNLGFESTLDAALTCMSNSTLDPGCGVLVDNFQSAVVQLLNPISDLPWIASGITWGAMILFYLIFVIVMPIEGLHKHSSDAHQPLEPIAEIEPGYTGTITRSDGKVIKRLEIRDSSFGRMSFLGGGGNRNRLSFFNSSARMSEMPLPYRHSNESGGGGGGGEEATELGFMISTGGDGPGNRASLLNLSRGGGHINPSGESLSPDAIETVVPRTRVGGLDRVRVTRNYPAILDDELALVKGDIIIVEKRFPDGWGVGRTAAGISGAFPLNCVEPITSASTTR